MEINNNPKINNNTVAVDPLSVTETINNNNVRNSTSNETRQLPLRSVGSPSTLHSLPLQLPLPPPANPRGLGLNVVLRDVAQITPNKKRPTSRNGSGSDTPPPLPKKNLKPPAVKTKWTIYVSTITKLLSSRKKFEKNNQYEEAEAVSSEIKDVLRSILAENSTHVRHSEFESTDPDGSFSVDNITCSACGGPDSENNDLYFCDNVGCNRAYHLKCLDPQLTPSNISSDPNEDWFCHQCNCLADCLILINKSYNTVFQTIDACLEGDLPINKNKTPAKSPGERKESTGKGRRSSSSTSSSSTSLVPSEKLIPLQLSQTETGPALTYTPNTFWGQTFTLVKRRIGDILKYNHFIDVITTQSQSDAVVLVEDLKKYLRLLKRTKLEVRNALLALVEFNRSHIRFPQLDADDEDGMVDVGEILCSKCGGTDTDDNDIFICDRKGCCRAYHAQCLDPPLNPTDISNKPDDDWFCWECRCLADCLVLINESLGTSYDNEASEVFVEALDDDDDFTRPRKEDDDDEEEEDVDYVPKERPSTNEETILSDQGSESDSEDDSSENDHEGDPDREHNDEHDEVDDDSNVSEDEVRHLLAEAGDDILTIPNAAPSSTSTNQTTDRISGRLRKKTPSSTKSSSLLPQEMIPLSKLKQENVEVNFPIAKVKGGKFLLGVVETILSGAPPIRYHLKYEDESEDIGVTWSLLKERYKDRLDYESYVAKAEAAAQNAKNDEVISAENILRERRAKPRLDYAKLFQEVYGNQSESEDDDYDEEDEEVLPRISTFTSTPTLRCGVNTSTDPIVITTVFDESLDETNNSHKRKEREVEDEVGEGQGEGQEQGEEQEDKRMKTTPVDEV